MPKEKLPQGRKALWELIIPQSGRPYSSRRPLGARDLSAIRSPNGQDQVPALAPFKSASLNQWLVTALVSVKKAMPSSPMQCRSP